MLASAGVYALPFLLTLGLVGLVRWIAGPERTLRFVGLALPLGFLLSWAIAVTPGWHAFDALGRIGHIVFGAAIVGFVLDFWQPRRVVAMVVVSVFVIGCAWAEANGGLWLYARPSVAVGLTFIALIVVGGGLAWRVDRLRCTEPPVGDPAAATLVLLLMAALALAVVAAMETATDMAALRLTGIVLALAIAGYLSWMWIAELPLTATAACCATAGLFALAWALVDQDKVTIPGVALAGLILFADGTARRVPLPRAGVSGVLYPLILAGMALLPLVLAAVLTAALQKGA